AARIRALQYSALAVLVGERCQEAGEVIRVRVAPEHRADVVWSSDHAPLLVGQTRERILDGKVASRAVRPNVRARFLECRIAGVGARHLPRVSRARAGRL